MTFLLKDRSKNDLKTQQKSRTHTQQAHMKKSQSRTATKHPQRTTATSTNKKNTNPALDEANGMWLLQPAESQTSPCHISPVEALACRRLPDTKARLLTGKFTPAILAN